MIGNDLIDLVTARKNSRLKNSRFRKKIFTAREENIIDKNNDPEATFWLLWSMKEAAYKIHQQETNSAPRLNPVKFECFPSEDRKTGKVMAFGKNYFTRTQFLEGFIHSIASAEKEMNYLQKNYLKSSDYKGRFSAFISKELALNTKLSIEKNEYHIPYFRQEKSAEKLPVSISHDGNLAALVFPLIKC